MAKRTVDADLYEDIQQAARLLRHWARDRQRVADGAWTAQEQAAIDCACRLEMRTKQPHHQVPSDA